MAYIGELILGTAPTSEPFDAEEARDHLRVDINDDNQLITDLISAARQAFEELNGRTLYTTTWKLILDAWPSESYLVLPRPPLASVTSIAYIDKDGNSSTFDSSNYVVETERTPGRVHLGYNKEWPSETLRPASPITVTYVAGWSSTSTIPERYKQAMKLLIGHWYENRESIVTTGSFPARLPWAFEQLAILDRVWI